MATFGAILGLVTPGITVDDIACTSKTLPTFEAMWAVLVGDAGQGSTDAEGSSDAVGRSAGQALADGHGTTLAAPASSIEEEQ